MRILLTAPTLDKPGGVAQYVRVLRPHFRDEIRYFTVGARSESEPGRHVLLRLAADWPRFAATLLRGRYDIVHLNPSLGPKALVRDGVLLLIAKAFRRTVIVFTHGWDKSCERALAGRLRPLFHFVYGRADAFIVLGKEFERSLRSLGYSKAVFVEPAPIEEDLLAPPDPALRDASGGPPRFRVLFLARMEREKGVYEALDAYGILSRKFPFVEMTMAGGGPELERAKRYAAVRGLAGIEFTGHVQGSAKRLAFSGADAYLFPSWSEGLPISVLEAMAHGLPVVARATGGLPDFFENGRMGFLTESPDPEVFASLLSQLIADPGLCASMGHFNRVYAREHFRATQVAARLEHIYRLVYGGAH